MVTAWLPGPWRFPYSVPQEGLRLSRWVVSSLSTSAWDAARARGHACKYTERSLTLSLFCHSLNYNLGLQRLIRPAWGGSWPSNLDGKGLYHRIRRRKVLSRRLLFFYGDLVWSQILLLFRRPPKRHFLWAQRPNLSFIQCICSARSAE